MNGTATGAAVDRRQRTIRLGAAAILSGLPVAVVALDGTDRFLFANPAAEQFFVASATQLVNLRLDDFVPAENVLFRLIGQVRKEGATITAHDFTLESPRLTRRGVKVHIAPLPECPGGVVVGLEDATLARPFNPAARLAAENSGVVGIAAVLAHEVKNPLSGIRGAAQLLEATSAPGDRELAILIRDEADRIRTLVERMEMLGSPPVNREAVNVHRLLEHVRRLARNGFAQHIRLVEAYDPSLPPALGDRDRLVQALLNLVKNAAEAINASGVPGGEIVLGTAFQQGVWLAQHERQELRHLPLVVSVRDNGPGIPAHLEPHLFDPFVSGKRGGYGLGLALVAKIVAEHGGLIDVESRPGRTEFRLHLPVATGGPGA